MSEQLLVWIMGICVVLFAAAMAAQGAAGFQLLRIIRPLLLKRRQLTRESKQLIKATENAVRDAKPRLSVTREKGRELSTAASRALLGWKQGIEEIPNPLARLRKRSRHEPKRVHTRPVAEIQQHKMMERSAED